MLDNERKYVDLLFRASNKYASWDPEVTVEVGDWGRITTGNRGFAFWRREQGTFIKEGNIYEDGKAEAHNIPPPKEFGAGGSEGVSWIVSENAEECDVGLVAGGQTPALAQCKFKVAFKFSSTFGAVLVMDNDTISTIDPPGSLRRLLDLGDMRPYVIVSEVHRCSSFARLLTAKKGGNVSIGLSMEPPVSGVASVTGHSKWIKSSNTGNFKSKVNKSGSHEYYPLFRLVSLQNRLISTGFRGSLDNIPLPDATPPWETKEHNRGVRDS